MGKNYAYVLVTTAARADDALAELAGLLVGPDRRRLLAALPWVPTITASHLPSSQTTPSVSGPRPSASYRCLVLKHEVGCVWTAIAAGEALFSMTAQAATTDMNYFVRGIRDYSEALRLAGLGTEGLTG